MDSGARANKGGVGELAHRLAPEFDFEASYHRELAGVWRYLYGLGARGAELEDLTHDVFLTAFRRRHTFDPSRPLLPWLCGIAFRVFSDARKRAHRQLEVGDVGVDIASDDPSMEAQVASRQAAALVEQALGTMDLEKRAVLIQHEIQEQSVPDIAEGLGIPVATAYSRLRYARTQFAAAVKRLQSRGKTDE
jgi:RNA polymerase sigma-70 factor (ECF subfamily)